MTTDPIGIEGIAVGNDAAMSGGDSWVAGNGWPKGTAAAVSGVKASKFCAAGVGVDIGCLGSALGCSRLPRPSR